MADSSGALNSKNASETIPSDSGLNAGHSPHEPTQVSYVHAEVPLAPYTCEDMARAAMHCGNVAGSPIGPVNGDNVISPGEIENFSWLYRDELYTDGGGLVDSPDFFPTIDRLGFTGEGGPLSTMCGSGHHTSREQTRYPSGPCAHSDGGGRFLSGLLGRGDHASFHGCELSPHEDLLKHNRDCSLGGFSGASHHYDSGSFESHHSTPSYSSHDCGSSHESGGSFGADA